MTTADFKKAMKQETKNIRAWEREINNLLKQEDTEYKFKSLANANSAIYSCYVRIDHLLSNYHPK